jgi:hypothetical protein
VFFALRVSVFYISIGQLLQMTNLLDGNASHNLSAVVTFTSRDLVMPKGVDGGEALGRSKEELRRAAERRALQVIVENENGMISDKAHPVVRG